MSLMSLDYIFEASYPKMCVSTWNLGTFEGYLLSDTHNLPRDEITSILEIGQSVYMCTLYCKSTIGYSIVD